MRTIFEMPDAEIAALDTICANEGWSRAQGIREAVRLLLEAKKIRREDAFGAWKGQENMDELAYQEAVRSAWERD